MAACAPPSRPWPSARRRRWARTDGVTNLVEVVAEPVGRVSFRGPGAGGPATASAVLADLLAIGAIGAVSTWGQLPPRRRRDRASPTTSRASAPGSSCCATCWARPCPPGIDQVALAASGDAFVIRPIALDALRARLAPLGIDVPLYPVISEA